VDYRFDRHAHCGAHCGTFDASYLSRKE
jgi:hypothetical protein